MENRFDDVYRWSLETVEALKAGDYSRVMPQVIEEIGSIASSAFRELDSILLEIINNILIIDGLTTASEVEKQDADRRLTHAQGQLSLILLSSASLNSIWTGHIEEAWRSARQFVLDYDRVELPETCFIPVSRIRGEP